MKRRKPAFLHEEVGETSTGQKHLRATTDEVVTASCCQVKHSYIHENDGMYFILPPAHISKVLVSKGSPVTPG